MECFQQCSKDNKAIPLKFQSENVPTALFDMNELFLHKCELCYLELSFAVKYLLNPTNSRAQHYLCDPWSSRWSHNRANLFLASNNHLRRKLPPFTTPPGKMVWDSPKSQGAHPSAYYCRCLPHGMLHFKRCYRYVRICIYMTRSLLASTGGVACQRSVFFNPWTPREYLMIS